MKPLQTIKNSFILFPALGGMFVLVTVFMADPSLTNGLVMGKVFWFHKAMVVLTIVTLLSVFFKKEYINIIIPDLLLLVFLFITLLTYNYPLHPEPEKLLFGGQLVVLWFVLRVLLKGFSGLKIFFLAFILLTGLTEAIWGLEQLYGYKASTHYLFRLTGSFFNPGPYSGYLAMVFPVALSFILRIGKQKRHPWWHFTIVLYYLSWITFIAILLVLPAGMSRSAWLAGIISCIWICLPPNPLKGGLKKGSSSFPPLFRWTGVVLLLCICVVGVSTLFMMKKDSANGRLLMWKVTAKAIAHQPLTGTGMGGFPAAFAEEQAAYFASGNASQTEKQVAGCPEYAFNEYLQIGLEQGIPGLMCFLFLLMCCFYYGVKNRRIGAAGGVLAFSVFAISSYPLQLPSFWILLIFLLVICVAGPCSFTPALNKHITCKVPVLCIALIAVIASSTLYCLQQKRYDVYKEWNTLTMLYNNKAYEAAIPEYKELYPYLNHKPEYLFEYAQCLSKTGHYKEANKLLNRATQVSTDPMIRYMIAKNEQALGAYEEAEKQLLYGIDILPERIYPYYLLAKLYAEPAYYNPGKLQAAVDSVLVKEPKVQTTAILEMREEVKKLLRYAD